MTGSHAPTWMTRRAFAGTVLFLLLVPALAAGQLVEKRGLTLESAKAMAGAAAAEAEQNDWAVVIAVVDEGGHLLYLERMDGVGTGIVAIAVGKAKTSAAYQAPTRVFAEMVAQGALQFLAIEGAVPIEGGEPILVDGSVIGAMGVSGVTAEEDGIVARAGVAALSTGPRPDR